MNSKPTRREQGRKDDLKSKGVRIVSCAVNSARNKT